MDEETDRRLRSYNAYRPVSLDTLIKDGDKIYIGNRRPRNPNDPMKGSSCPIKWHRGSKYKGILFRTNQYDETNKETRFDEEKGREVTYDYNLKTNGWGISRWKDDNKTASYKERLRKDFYAMKKKANGNADEAKDIFFNHHNFSYDEIDQQIIYKITIDVIAKPKLAKKVVNGVVVEEDNPFYMAIKCIDARMMEYAVENNEMYRRWYNRVRIGKDENKSPLDGEVRYDEWLFQKFNKKNAPLDEKVIRDQDAKTPLIKSLIRENIQEDEFGVFVRKHDDTVQLRLNIGRYYNKDMCTVVSFVDVNTGEERFVTSLDELIADKTKNRFISIDIADINFYEAWIFGSSDCGISPSVKRIRFREYNRSNVTYDLPPPKISSAPYQGDEDDNPDNYNYPSYPTPDIDEERYQNAERFDSFSKSNGVIKVQMQDDDVQMGESLRMKESHSGENETDTIGKKRKRRSSSEEEEEEESENEEEQPKKKRKKKSKKGKKGKRVKGKERRTTFTKSKKK